MDGYETTILVDAAPRGQPPGTLYLIEPDLERIDGPGNVDAHSMNPMAVLQLIQALGGRTGKLYLVGCEPGVLETDEIWPEPERARGCAPSRENDRIARSSLAQ